MDTLKAIAQRASLKSYISGKPVEPEKIEKVLEAGRLAPSTGNSQPWRFIVVNDKEKVRQLVQQSFNMEVNAAAAEAPVLLIALANRAEGKVSHNVQYYSFDIGMAIENMLIAAADQGLITNLMTNLNREALKSLLGVPEEMEFIVATPLAYPNTDSVEQAVQERRKSRPHKELGEIVYWNSWGAAK